MALDDLTEESKMSAFICSKLHIQTVALYYSNVYKLDKHLDCVKIANQLYKENIKSVNFRYGENTKLSYWRSFDDSIKKKSYIELYKLVQCLNYQSCEHNEWESSNAYKILNELTKFLTSKITEKYKIAESQIYSLPDYINANWSI
jgi:hypothetical protein